MKLLKMIGSGSWTTAKDVTFTSSHPFQLVDDQEIQYLPGDRFVETSPDELKKYYGRDKIDDTVEG